MQSAHSIKPIDYLTIEEAYIYGHKAVRLGMLYKHFHVVPGFAWPFDHKCSIDSIPKLDFPVILRSSHRLEDLSHQSQAGMYPSFINIQNEQELKEIILHLENTPLKSEPFFVQHQLTPDYSGVYFTKSPIHIGMAELVIKKGANFEITSGKEVYRSILIDENGNILSQDNSLPFEVISKLWKIGAQLECITKNPQDIEWAFCQNKIYILQARGDTSTIARKQRQEIRNAEVNRLENSLSQFQSFWTDSSIGDVLFGSSPMTLNMFQRASESGGSIELCYQRLGFYYRPIDSTKLCIFDTCFGRPYINLGAYQKALFGFVPLKPNQNKENLEFKFNLKEIVKHPLKTLSFILRIPVIFVKIYKRSKLLEVYFKKLPPIPTKVNSLAEFFKCMQIDFKEAVALHLECDVQSAFLLLRCKFWLKLVFGKDASQMEAKLFTGLTGNTNTVANYAIMDLAHDKISWDEFVTQFGYRASPDWDIGSPRWREKPDLLMKLIEKTKELPYVNREALQKAIQRNALIELEHSISKKWKLLRGWILSDLKQYQVLSPLREITQAYCYQWIDFFRENLILIANQIGISKDDLFYLHLDEIMDTILQNPEVSASHHSKDCNNFLLNHSADPYCKKNHRNRMSNHQMHHQNMDTSGFFKDLNNFKLNAMIKIAQKRKRDYKILRSWSAPHNIHQGNLKNFTEEKTQTKGDYLQGKMASLGYAKGPALVIDDVSQIHQLSGNEILVLKFCEPSMSMWLLQCQGLILEQGNPLSHGAIVAREMGVPCLYGVENACQQIQDGELIEFDAQDGKIRRCNA